jgi:hypothetical protein
MRNLAVNLQQVILLSQTILEKAQQECWDEVALLETERRKLIELFFSKPLQPEDAKTVGVDIQSILAIDRETMALGSLTMLNLSENMHKIEQGKKAVKAYGA